MYPIFENYNTTFTQIIRIGIPRNIKEDIKVLNWGEKYWRKWRLKSQSQNCDQKIQKYISIISNNVPDIIMQNQKPNVCRQISHDCYYNIQNGMSPIFKTYNTKVIQRIGIRIRRNIKQDLICLKGGGRSSGKWYVNSQL